jgi:hypothetical protein
MADLPTPATALLEIPVRYEWFLNMLRELDEFVNGVVPCPIDENSKDVVTNFNGDNCSGHTKEAWGHFYRLAMSEIAHHAYPRV